MEIHGLLIKFWIEQSLVFTENWRVARNRPAKKAVHDLRVSVKKLKSCLSLLSAVYADREPMKFVLVQQLFRVTGKFRDIDNCITLLAKIFRKDQRRLESFEKYLQTLRSITRRMSKESAQLPLEEELGGITTRFNFLLSEMPAGELGHRASKEAQALFYGVKDLIKEGDKQAHEIRKRLKRLYYWLSLFPENPVFDLKYMKTLDQSLKALGEWHDHFVLGAHIRDYRKDFLVKETPDYALARELEKIINTAQGNHLSIAYQRINILFNAANRRATHTSS
ncbi:MAG: CHAD domain-containing protein [Chitinophagaceae bacterium]